MMKNDGIVLQITELAKQFVNLPKNGGDTPEEAAKIDKKKASLQRKIKKLKRELLFNQYMDLQSNDFKKNITGYKELSMPGKEIAIRVNFTWGWLRVYRTKNNSIEWY